MSLNALFDSLDNIEKAAKFFVDLTERLGDGELDAGEEVMRLSRSLGVPYPPELAGASIVSLGSGEITKLATEPTAERSSPQIVIYYPPVFNPCQGQIEKTIRKCFKVCQSVGGAKVCAEVCVNINIGLSGIGGKITATVSVAF
jgi:hypothetical protein